MNSANLFLLIFAIFHCVLTKPVEEKTTTMYEAIEEICPFVKQVPSYKEHKIFDVCTDWKKISTIDKFTWENRNQIHCLLYFEGFTQYCNNTKTFNENSLAGPFPALNITTICDYFKTIPKNNVKKILANDKSCENICGDEMGVQLEPVCIISYNFAHIGSIKQKATEQAPQPSIAHNPSDAISGIKTAQVAASAPEEKKSESAGLSDKKTPPVNAQSVAQVQPAKYVQHVDAQPPQKPAVVLPEEEKLHPDIPTEKKSPPNRISEKDAQQTVVEVTNVETEKKPATNTNVEKPSEPETVETKISGKTPEIVAPVNDNKGVEHVDEIKGDDLKNKVLEQDNIQESLQNPVDVGKDIPIDDPEPEVESDGEGIDDRYIEPQVKPPQAKEDKKKISKPQIDDESDPANYSTEMEGDSYFFTYFMLFCIIFIAGYVCYHNKQKILALILEGRRGKRQQYRGRRPNSANYHKLDSNLEEAITSSCKKNATNVIY